MSKPIIAVVGATGAQGGSVVRHLHASGKWRVIALTRNPDSPKALHLAEQGVDVVKCDTLKPSDLESAFKGAYGVFGVTFVDFETDLDETIQGINIVNAVKAQKVQHLVLSTLPNAEKCCNGKRKVTHFTRKANFGEYARNESTGSFSFTAVQASAYYENNLVGAFGPRLNKDGKLAISMSAYPTSKIPMFSVEDTGGVVAAIFDNKEKYNGKAIPLVGDYITFQEVVTQLSKVAGKEIVYDFVPEEIYATLFTGAVEVGDMFGFMNENGYFNEKQEPEKEKDMWLGKETYPAIRTLSQWAEDVKYAV
eukprot:Phypoly_transcript_11988.p1 GENE.Phypoly_transcript_11988~~Phypoly_transcript_11988.p1  ORF type:complete len:308 (-),score=46.28 Phypoly_transcript_11988:192-1115(-)